MEKARKKKLRFKKLKEKEIARRINASDIFPSEIWTEIFSHISPFYLDYSVKYVCNLFNDIATDSINRNRWLGAIYFYILPPEITLSKAAYKKQNWFSIGPNISDEQEKSIQSSNLSIHKKAKKGKHKLKRSSNRKSRKSNKNRPKRNYNNFDYR